MEEKLEKVLAGIEACKSSAPRLSCQLCPYCDLRDCDDRLLEDAAELIRAAYKVV